MANFTNDASVNYFVSLVNKDIESNTSSMASLGISDRDLPGFASQVDNAIRSSTAVDLGTSCVHGFASQVDGAMRSSNEDLGVSRVHGFTSQVYNDIRSKTIAKLSSQVVIANAPEWCAHDRILCNSIHIVAQFSNRVEKFTLAKLLEATNNFSLDNLIGTGSFGLVYKGKLIDGLEVAIKRGEFSSNMRKFQEKLKAFGSELALSYLHHKHLVGLVGFCEEKNETLLVYEYMKNGALYDHLHDKNNVEKGSSLLNSWRMRIKIALDASRGIEYLHNYAVPSIIHRDIKSSNILLDATWMVRVSDFGLSLMSPEPDCDYRPIAGTIGHMDPECYRLNVLTAKSDVYGFGVVLLELLTGKRSIFRHGEDGGTPLNVVDFAVPAIMAGELVKILDPRVGAPDVNEGEAVELMAYTAIHCVTLEGKDRPTIADIAVNLERALAICDSGHDGTSTSAISIV